MKLFISILISLGVGGLSALFTNNSMDIYKNLNLPSFAPPSFIFPIVWTILFILMGVSSYFIYKKNDKLSKPALFSYAVQLILNFFWTIIFFNIRNYLLSFIWIILLDVAIIIMLIYFYKVDKRAFYLQIPYLIWTLFATILTYNIFILN